MFTNNQQTNTFLAYLLPITYFSTIVALLVFQSLAFQKSFFPVDQKLLPMTLRCNGNQIAGGYEHYSIGGDEKQQKIPALRFRKTGKWTAE